MARRHGENGAALVTALMLTTLALVVAMALLYTVTAGSKISASQKRYRNALAAAHGGVDLVTQEIIPRILGQMPPTDAMLQDDFSLIALQIPGYPCLKQKLTTPSAEWSALCAPASADPAEHPDLSFKLGSSLPTEPGFQVTMKILDTVPGNSDADTVNLLDPGDSVAAPPDGVVRPQHIPSYFSIAVQGVGGTPREKARLSLLYAY